MEAKEQKKKSIKKRILLYLTIFIIVTLLVLISPLFSIKNVVIESSVDKTLEESSLTEIESHLDSTKGKNGYLFVLNNMDGISNIRYFFGMRAKNVEESLIFSFPKLKNINVKFDFPNSLNVTYDLREEAYFINDSGTYICADSEGFILGVYSDNEKNLPVVNGIKLESYKIGQFVSSENKEQIKALKNVFSEINQSDLNSEFKLSECIEIVDVTEYNKIWIFINDNLAVSIGSLDNIEYKIPALKEILQVNDMLNKKGLIDFTVSSDPVFRPHE